MNIKPFFFCDCPLFWRLRLCFMNLLESWGRTCLNCINQLSARGAASFGRYSDISSGKNYIGSSNKEVSQGSETRQVSNNNEKRAKFDALLSPEISSDNVRAIYEASPEMAGGKSLTKTEALDLLDQAPESAIEKSSGNSRPTEDASARNAAGGPPTGKQSLNNILKKYLAVNNKNTANTETPINNIRNKNADIDEKAESYF